MAHSWKSLPAAFVAMLLVSACEIVDVIEVAVSGPECGSFGMPPELEDKNLSLLDPNFDWDRLDEMIAMLESYEHSHGPDVLFSLGISYIMKASTLSDDPAYYRRGVRLFHWAALCGESAAVLMLSGAYSEGYPGVERDPELGACLDRIYYLNLDKRKPIPGPVWGCGLRVEDLPE